VEHSHCAGHSTLPLSLPRAGRGSPDPSSQTATSAPTSASRVSQNPSQPSAPHRDLALPKPKALWGNETPVHPVNRAGKPPHRSTAESRTALPGRNRCVRQAGVSHRS
jgi:hypothetical protein